MKTLLIVGAGPVQVEGIQRARQLGFRVVATDGNPKAPGLELADVPVVLDMHDIEGAIRLAEEHRVDGVLCVAVGAAVQTVAAVADHLNLSGVCPTAAEHACAKHLMRAKWAEGGIASPAFRSCTTVEQAERAANELGLAVVVKPSDSAGSRGVSWVGDPGGVIAAYERAMAFSKMGVVVVEAYMEGVELSVEAFVYHDRMYVMGLSDKIRTQPPYLLDTAVLFPSIQPEQLQREAVDLVERAVAALGVDQSAIHAEVMVTPEGLSMVELAARGSGFKVFTHMLPWHCGIDVIEASLRMAVGESPVLETSAKRGAVLVFPSTRPGHVRSVSGIEEARTVDHVTDVEVYVQPGGVLKPLTSGADRLGHIIALADTREEAEKAAREAEQLIQLETDERKPVDTRLAPPTS